MERHRGSNGSIILDKCIISLIQQIFIDLLLLLGPCQAQNKVVIIIDMGPNLHTA